MSSHEKGSYYLPAPSYWPIVGTVGLTGIALGIVNWLHGHSYGPYLLAAGALVLIVMMFGWFGTVIAENKAGLLSNAQVDRSFRWAMIWFIFTEVLFFGCFFGALFYARVFSVPWLGGDGSGELTHLLLWPAFDSAWPLLKTPDPSLFQGPHSILNTWGIPAINTAILLSSGVTVTIAHWGVIKEKRMQMLTGQLLTICLGIVFLCMQAYEYWLAHHNYALTLSAGIYGSTFFMLTGFHALHVTIGAIGLIVIFVRMYKGHFTRHNHFGFEAITWYWHFVDVVWLLLFIFVYWL